MNVPSIRLFGTQCTMQYRYVHMIPLCTDTKIRSQRKRFERMEKLGDREKTKRTKDIEKNQIFSMVCLHELSILMDMSEVFLFLMQHRCPQLGLTSKIGNHTFTSSNTYIHHFIKVVFIVRIGH